MEAWTSHPGEGEALHAGPTSSIVRVPGAATDQRLSVVEMTVQADWPGPPPHVHERIDHVWFVLDGEIQLTVDDGTATYGPGSCVFVPAGTSHGFGTSPHSAATMLQIDTPEALDAYFRELATTFPPGAPVDPAQVGDVMRRHDTFPVP